MMAITVSAWAQGPVGNEFQVNSTTAGDQANPVVGMAPDGRFVVVWEEPELRARRFDAAGSPVGDDFQVNEDPVGDQFVPAVAIRPDGSFLVAWSDSAPGVECRLFDRDGIPLTGDVLIDFEGEFAAVDARSDGSFVVVYTGGPYPGGYDHLYYRFVDASGMPTGVRFEAEGTYSIFPFRPRVDVNAADAFVITWDSQIIDTFADTFGADGLPNGPRRRFSWGQNSDVSVGAGGRYTAIWNDVIAEVAMLSRFGDDGAPIGDHAVLGKVTGYGLDLGLARDADDQLLAGWIYDDLRMQTFAADGTSIGRNVPINTDTGGDPSGLAMAEDGAGVAIAVWATQGTIGSDTADRSIHARFLRLPEFSDGFESGDLTRWSFSAARPGP